MIPLAIGAAVIAFYFPVAIFTFYLTSQKDAGYIFLFVFTIIRLVEGALLIPTRVVPTTADSLYTTAYILDSAGLTLLFLATLGFLGLVRRSGSASDNARISRVFLTSPTAPVSSFLALVTLTAFCLSAISAKTNKASQSHRLREVSAVIFAVVYGLLVVVHLAHQIYYCRTRHRVDDRGISLLLLFTLLIPFLAVRVA